MKRHSLLTMSLIVILFCGFITSDTDIYFKINKSIELFGRVYRETATNYVDNINPQELMESGIEGMLSTLDPYTVYLDKSHQNDIDLITKGKYGGIGATIGLRNDKITVVDLIEGYSAHRQGIMIGDIILKIDDVEVNKDNYDKLGTFMKGEPGTAITVLIRREGAKSNLVFNLIREEIEVKNVTYSGFVPEESNNLYIKLSGFSRAAGEEVKDAILDLGKQKPIHTIVLDMRGNPGGLLDAAIDVSEKFLNKEQLVVSVVGRDTLLRRRYFAKEEPIAGNTKLAILIDGYSASATEIVTGAIQDHDRGIVIGEKSFGKGLVQTIIPMPYNASLKITTAKYYTPSGRCIQKIDYSKNNDVLLDIEDDPDAEFKTDAERTVYAKGGILPDSIVTGSSDSDLIRQLIAHGMFFRYVTTIFSGKDSTASIDTTPGILYKNFINYLHDEEFEFYFETEKVLSKLKNIVKEKNYNSSMPDKVNELISMFESEKLKELEHYKPDIVNEIKLEIFSRTEGRKGRIRESLKSDKQFETALSMLHSDEIYNKILKKVE